jgi:hypothetical protein
MIAPEARLDRFQGRTRFGDPLLRGCAPLFTMGREPLRNPSDAAHPVSVDP